MLLFLFSLALFWVFLHLISSFFPSHNSNFNGPRTSVTLTSYTSLHLSTTALNNLPLALVKPFKKKKAWLESYWDVGVVVVCLGIVAAQLVLGWTAWRSLGALWQLLGNLREDEEKVGMRIGVRLMKRLLESISETKDRLILRPVIPGLTQPLSALPLLLLALFISQTFHELGHALAAASFVHLFLSLPSKLTPPYLIHSESIPTLSLGIYLHLFLPTFYVSLPESNGANALAELRIATGGVWHNFVLVGLVWALSSKGGGLGKFGESSWSKEVEGGVMVIDVDSNSPLYPLLSPYNLITHLNDLELDSSDSPIDLWSTYLSNSSPVSDTYEDLGWCLPLTLFDSSPRGCCDPSHQPGKDDPPLANPQLCFTSPSSDSSTQSACLDPLPYFPPSHSIPPRCLTSSSCVDKGTICARPELGEQVVRIGVARFGEREREGKTIVWQGRRKGVLEHVSVTGRKPRFLFVPLSFSRGVERMYSHILSLSLAVAFFNLLPLPHLDGTHILTAFFQCLTPSSQPNFSTLEEGRRSSRSKSILEKQFESLRNFTIDRSVVGKSITDKSSMGTSSMSRSPLLEYLEALSLPVLVLSNSGIDLSPILANFALQRITEGADFLSCLLPGEGEKLSRWIVEERWRELGDEVEIIISSSSSARSGRRLRSTDRKSIHTRWKVTRSHDLGQDIIIFTGTTNDFKPRLDLSSIPSFTSPSSNPMSFPSPLLTPSDELVLTPTERFKELELLLDLCSVGVARLDLSGKLIWVNRAWRDVADHPIDLPLEDWPKNIDERDVEGLTTEWAYCVKNLVRLDYQFRVKSGKVVLAHVTPNHADPALITGWISNLIDVTKRVKGEEAVTALALERVMAVRQQEAVEHAEARRRDAEQQRQQQEQLIDIVSHEIRNPISAIMQNSELTHASLVRLRNTLATTLQMDCCDLPTGLSTNTLTQLDEDIESLESISECAMAQERIANDILGLAQIQLGKYCIARTYFRIASSLNSTLRMFHSECRAKDIVLRLELGSTLERLGSPPMLSGDPVRLSQIIINLISNALRFTADSPTREVTLQVDVSYLAPVEGEPLLVPDDSEFLPHADSPLYFYFSVSDSGQGMTEEQTGRIFERFMQASPFTHHMGGSGLGLWISRNLCELHGGKIEVVSSVGVGSTFRGYVLAGPIKPQFPSPLSPASTSLSLAPAPPSAENGHHVNSSTTVSSGITYPMLRILVAEDNEINKRILVRQLQASGHEVVAANDGREALEKLMDPEGMQFDCCLMDVEMPHISGVEATKAIRLAEKGKGKGSRRLRIVGCTGNAREGQIKSALEAGMDTIVTKPYRISHLLEAVAGDSKHDDSQMDSSA